MTTSELQSEKFDVAAQLVNLVLDMSFEQQLHLLQLLEKWRYKGRRRSRRQNCLIAVDYATRSNVFRDFIHDISADGVFIETSVPFAVGQEIRLVFTHPGRSHPIKVAGEIVRTSTKGVGVKFKRLHTARTKAPSGNPLSEGG